MKKISIIASALLLSSSMLSADITIKSGWQLLGATQDMNATMFDNTCVDYIWKYNSAATTPEWQIHVANGVGYAHNMTEITSFTKGEGYWAKGNGNCTIPLAESTPIFATGDTWKCLVYGTITSAETGRLWLDRNLGASQVCTALDDTACYGDYYQWGRAADASFITGSSDWTTADSDGALRAAEWSKTDGSSICPVGYRVPTRAEFDLELANSAITNKAEAYNKLKLPSSGSRSSSNGSIGNQGSYGYFWSSGVSGTYSDGLLFSSSSASTGSYHRARGYPVRCVKD